MTEEEKQALLELKNVLDKHGLYIEATQDTENNQHLLIIKNRKILYDFEDDYIDSQTLSEICGS